VRFRTSGYRQVNSSTAQAGAEGSCTEAHVR